MNTCQLVAAKMIAAGKSGSIVNVSSIVSPFLLNFHVIK